MSLQDSQQSTPTRRFSTKSTLLIVLIVGLAAGAVAYELGMAFTANAQNTSTQSTTDSGYRNFGYGPRPWGGGYGGNGNCTRYDSGTGFLATSRVSNVTVTGFNIASSNQITVNLAYAGSGTAPAVTIGAVAPGLAGSTTLTAGWGTAHTVTVNLTGSGSLTTMRFVRVIILPLTG